MAKITVGQQEPQLDDDDEQEKRERADLLKLLTPEVIGLMSKLVKAAGKHANTERAAELLECLSHLTKDLWSLSKAPDCTVPEKITSPGQRLAMTNSEINRVIVLRRIHAEHEKRQAKFDKRLAKADELMGRRQHK